MFTKISRVLVLCAVFNVAACRRNEYGIECKTESNIRGKCVRFKDCRHLTDATEGKPFEEAKRIRIAWKCSTVSPLVCCPQEYVPPPPNVSGHRNLRLLPKGCGDSDENKAFSGNQTGIQEFPWMALIFSINDRGINDFHCAGSIINNRYILTAAHCIDGVALSEVRVGEHDLLEDPDCENTYNGQICNPPVQNFAIEKAITHPGYLRNQPGRSPSVGFDIGLIRVAGIIDTSKENVYPICLPTTMDQQQYNLNGKIVTMAGWGRTNVDREGNIDWSIAGNRGRRSTKLLKIDTPIIPNLQCGLKMNRSIEDGIGYHELCAGGEEFVGTCNGDSGGPLVVAAPRDNTIKNVQFGIVSFGIKSCGVVSTPSIYTRVAYYMEWILDNMKP